MTLSRDTQSNNTLSLTPHHPHTVIRPRARTSIYEALRRVVKGTVYEPSDPGYEATVTPWNLAVSMRPAAVIAAAHADDVAAAVRFAAARGLRVGVQATGHGAVSSLAGQLLVSTKGLDEVTVHPGGWAGPAETPQHPRLDPGHLYLPGPGSRPRQRLSAAR